MVKKVNKTVLMSIRVPSDLKQKIDDLRAEYKRQGINVNLNSTLIEMLEKEVKKMQKEVREKNPTFEFNQEELKL